MEITLEKIELVKDRTGVSYKEAKEALEAADGSVVDAIINIEETINMGSRGKIGAQSAQLLDRIKEIVKKGNVSKITVKKDGTVLLNLPINVGVVGAVLAPWAALAGVLAAFGTKCEIEILKDDGEVIEVSGIANDTFSDVMEKGAGFMEDVKVMGADVIDTVRTKAQNIAKRPEKYPDEDWADEAPYQPGPSTDDGYVPTAAGENTEDERDKTDSNE
ncbi:MAG: DUF4342 domain-containing protein [Clostridiales Family XIII bacterium]|jgi:hypothetical protein|nr:DUF4342 domain-containing protein [Clostridiales Family XIII bacterium]